MRIAFYYASQAEKDIIIGVLGVACKRLSVDGVECEISFVGRDAIRSLNASTRGVDKVTDVLSFPAIDGVDTAKLTQENYPSCVDYDTGNLILGEIVICKSKAREQALEYNHTYERELAFLALHGFLHLCGYDHIEESDRLCMEALQREIIVKWTEGNE